MKNKKILAIVALLLSVAFLAGCVKNNQSDTSKNTAKPASKTPAASDQDAVQASLPGTVAQEPGKNVDEEVENIDEDLQAIDDSSLNQGLSNSELGL